MGGFAKRMVAAKGNPFTEHLTENRQEAIRDTSYVIIQLRVGWMQARREDALNDNQKGTWHQFQQMLGCQNILNQQAPNP